MLTHHHEGRKPQPMHRTDVHHSLTHSLTHC
jgi:hypothetical protein